MNIGYKLIKNCMAATAEKAPYLGMAIPVGSLAYDNILKEMIKAGTKMTQPTAKFFLDALYEFAAEKIAADVVRINLGTVSIYPMIDGSFDSEDAAFDPERNSLQLAVRLDDDVKNELADVVPAIVSDASVTKLRVDNVMDIEIPRPFNLIHGKHVFSVAGLKMVLDDEGAEVFLQNARGTTFEVVIDEVKSSQLFTAHTAAILEPGDYKLIVKSRGGDAEGPLQTVFRKVKYLQVVDPPTVDSIATEGKEGIVKGEAFAATGTNLSFGEGDSVTVKWTEDGEEKSLEIEPSATTPTKMDFAAVEGFDEIPDDTELTFEFELSGETVEGETRILGE